MSDSSFAELDLDRENRCGFPEFIYGAGKTPGQITAIMKQFREAGKPVLATRLKPDAFPVIRREIPDAEIHETARTALIRDNVVPHKGTVAIVCAGTSDLPVAEEACDTLEICGYTCNRINDVGVAGIHRLLKKIENIRKADVVIAIAGMEGALPSVLAGLVALPVIAVPTSVGYGASFNGVTALLAMINSCASGVTVVNIDNGFGAACAAARILQGKRI